MKRFNLSSPQDFMALLVRRKWWIVYPFLALSGAVVLLTYMLPKMYVSEALVLIRPRDVPKDFVKDLISGTTEQRVSTIEQIVLSRTNLVKILNEFEAQFPEYRRLNSEDRVTRLRKQIGLNFSVDRPIGKEELPLTYFRISYKNGSPALAQKITERVTELFIQEDNRVREAQVNGTTQFLEDALNKISEKLKESDTKYKSLMASRRNSLPDQLTTNLATLSRLEDQRRTDIEARDRAATSLSSLERELDSTPEFIAKQVAPPPPAPVVVPNPSIEEYKKARAQLRDLASKGYRQNHPDVQTATLRLAAVTKELTAEELASIDKKEEKTLVAQPPQLEKNPVYQRLLGDRDKAKTDLELGISALNETVASIASYGRRLDDAPASEQAIREVARENIDLNKQYQEMNDMVNKAKLSESAESSQKGSQFVTVDAANFPLSPTKPAKSAIAGIGVLMCLLVSIAFAIAVDFANQKMWTLSDVEALLGTTVLVEIPEIVTQGDLLQARKKRRKHILSFAVMAAAYTVCLYVVYLNQSFVLRKLDVVLQRLY